MGEPSKVGIYNVATTSDTEKKNKFSKISQCDFKFKITRK